MNSKGKTIQEQGDKLYNGICFNLELSSKCLFGEVMALYELSEVNESRRQAFKQYLGRVVSSQGFKNKKYFQRQVELLFPEWKLRGGDVSEPVYA